MKFTEVRIENFGTIGQAVVQLGDRGLVLIQGENRDNSSADSNGAGKSTVAEAICWALYGKTARGSSGDSIVNRAVGKGCRVRVFVEDGDETYRIARHRKHKQGKNALTVNRSDDGGVTSTDLTKGTDRLTQEVVDKIIGCPYEVFTAAVYAGQEAMPDLPSMTDKQLKLLIEEAAGITLLEQAYEIAKKNRGTAIVSLDNHEREIERAEQKLKSTDDQIDLTKRSVQRWKAERDARVMDLEAEAKQIVADVRLYNDTLKKLPSNEKLDKEQERLKDALAKRDRRREEYEAAEKEAVKLESKAAGHEKLAGAEVERSKAFKKRLTEVENKKGAPCSNCGRPHDNDSLAKAIEFARDELEKQKNVARQHIQKLKDARQRASEARDSATAAKQKIDSDARLNALADDLNSSRRQLDLAEANKRNAVKRYREKMARIDAEKALENPHVADLSDLTKRQGEERATLRKLKDTLPDLQKKVQVARGVVDVYSPAGVRAHILDTVTPYLNERTADYLGTLSDGQFEALWQTVTLTAKGEARERFSISVTDTTTGGGFTDLSGGEKRKVRLACALALQDLVATRATKQIDLWIGDEIDNALDSAGLERLMSVLEQKAEERGTVLVVSHSDLRDWFRNTLTVVKENNMATVA